MMATGRFAPTPSGSLHLGSLAVALFSYIEIKRLGGRWLLRFDDGDSLRVRPESKNIIKAQLSACGLMWDGEYHQSARQAHYLPALEKLRPHLYPCQCTREQSRTTINRGACPCWHQPAINPPHAWRLHQQDGDDFVVVRKDGLIAYQLMSAVDDAPEGDLQITQVVRGADLLTSTQRQMAIHRLLGWSSPRYAFLPLIVLADGKKLSKSESALPINPDFPLEHARSFVSGVFDEVAGKNKTRLNSPQTLDNRALPLHQKTPNGKFGINPHQMLPALMAVAKLYRQSAPAVCATPAVFLRHALRYWDINQVPPQDIVLDDTHRAVA